MTLPNVLPALALMAAPPGSSGGATVFIVQLVGFGLVFYFFFIRPQSQARKKHEAILATLKKGDEVTTAGGLIGKVKNVDENRVTVESGTATVVVDRNRIIRVGDSVAPGTPS